MFNAEKKTILIEEFKRNAQELFNSVKSDCDLKTAMLNGDVDDVRGIVKRCQSIMVANIPEGVDVPKTSLYTSPTTAAGDDSISLVNITISNKISADKVFKYSTTVTREGAIDKVLDFMMGVYITLIVDKLVSKNLERVNDVIAQAVAESGITYGVKIVSSLGNEGKKIARISDDEVVFVADESRVFDLDKIIVLLEEPTELITAEVIQQHYNDLVEEFANAQTPEQLVSNHGGVLVAHVCDISKRLKAMTLIKKVCTKNVTKVHGDKDTVAYFADGDVFSLVAKRDGNFEVILAPFDVNTFRKVDYDVLKAIG